MHRGVKPAPFGRRDTEMYRTIRRSWLLELWERTGSLYSGWSDDDRPDPGEETYWCEGGNEPTSREVFAEGFSPAMTLEEIGAELGISRERVRAIESEALRKLRNVIRKDPQFHAMGDAPRYPL